MGEAATTGITINNIIIVFFCYVVGFVLVDVQVVKFVQSKKIKGETKQRKNTSTNKQSNDMGSLYESWPRGAKGVGTQRKALAANSSYRKAYS